MILGGAGLILHCTVIAFVYLATGLVAPLYALLLLLVVWAALLVAAVRWFRSGKPALALTVPFIALGVWLVVLTLGGSILGWTA